MSFSTNATTFPFKISNDQKQAEAMWTAMQSLVQGLTVAGVSKEQIISELAKGFDRKELIAVTKKMRELVREMPFVPSRGKGPVQQKSLASQVQGLRPTPIQPVQPLVSPHPMVQLPPSVSITIKSDPQTEDTVQPIVASMVAPSTPVIEEEEEAVEVVEKQDRAKVVPAYVHFMRDQVQMTTKYAAMSSLEKHRYIKKLWTDMEDEEKAPYRKLEEETRQAVAKQNASTKPVQRAQAVQAPVLSFAAGFQLFSSEHRTPSRCNLTRRQTLLQTAWERLSMADKKAYDDRAQKQKAMISALPVKTANVLPGAQFKTGFDLYVEDINRARSHPKGTLQMSLDHIRSMWSLLSEKEKQVYEVHAIQERQKTAPQVSCLMPSNVPVCRTPFEIYADSHNKRATEERLPMQHLSSHQQNWNNSSADVKKHYESLALSEMAQAYGIQPTISQIVQSIPIMRSGGAHRTGFEIYESEHHMSKSTNGAAETRKAFIEMCWRMLSPLDRQNYDFRARAEVQKKTQPTGPRSAFQIFVDNTGLNSAADRQIQWDALGQNTKIGYLHLEAMEKAHFEESKQAQVRSSQPANVLPGAQLMPVFQMMPAPSFSSNPLASPMAAGPQPHSSMTNPFPFMSNQLVQALGPKASITSTSLPRCTSSCTVKFCPGSMSLIYTHAPQCPTNQPSEESSDDSSDDSDTE